VKLQEKIDWFWSTGTLPGSIFGDWNDGRAAQQRDSCRRQIAYLRTGTRKRPEEMSEQQADHRLSTAIESCVAWLANRSTGQ
jgi:hypothetical protein